MTFEESLLFSILLFVISNEMDTLFVTAFEPLTVNKNPTLIKSRFNHHIYLQKHSTFINFSHKLCNRVKNDFEALDVWSITQGLRPSVECDNNLSPKVQRSSPMKCYETSEASFSYYSRPEMIVAEIVDFFLSVFKHEEHILSQLWWKSNFSVHVISLNYLNLPR